jgi:8-oxo-dGTP pyrophosphatase MutT (NUDIX family)
VRGATDYDAQQRQAEAEGRQPVVGALIRDQAGNVFVHRRGPERRLLPGCWDIVGGHVEGGERLEAALAREIHEETGWRLVGTPELIAVNDWETTDDGQVHRRREFDFAVEVAGDLSTPTLEWPKHTEYRWVGADDVSLLDENRGADDNLIRRLVEIALAR